MKSIYIEDNLKVDISEYAWINMVLNSNNHYALRNNYKTTVEKDLTNNINKESDVYKMFNKHIGKYKFENGLVAKSFKEAEDIINNTVKFTEIFNIGTDMKFESDFYTKTKLKITKNNKLMFLDKAQKVYNHKKYQMDTYKRTVSIIQLYMIVNMIGFYQKALEDIANELNVIVDCEEMKIKQTERLKVSCNLLALDNLDRYPNLSKLINKNMFLLKSVHLTCLNSTNIHAETNNDDLIFVATSYYLHDYLENIVAEINVDDNVNKIKVLDERYIRRLMKLYVKLGLINEVGPTESLLMNRDENKEYIDKLKYYTLPKYDVSNLNEIEERARLLRKHHVTASNITNQLADNALKDISIEKKKSAKKQTFFHDFSIH